ncbi:hypothetical protein FOL47_002628 [Perkinsus chesapeaki]|uniref:K Homology domain-containing protein n=1 Tax=Perkinsus chesapeaki TaxID=330153 RepID=A0A7J6MCF9_PERCH|nr:hypothetical protein FOL47_002628 [Perkinsus chesapeaki]
MARSILIDVGMQDLVILGQQGIKSVPSRSTRKRKARAKLAAKVRDERFRAGPYWFKMLIPEATAGVIMGHGGSTLINLEKETLAAIKLSPYGSYFANSCLRVLVVAAPTLEALEKVITKIVANFILEDDSSNSIYISLASPEALAAARNIDPSLRVAEPTLQHGNESIMEVSLEDYNNDKILLSIACAAIAVAIQFDRSHISDTVRLAYDANVQTLADDMDTLVDAHFCNIVCGCKSLVPPATLDWLSKNYRVEIDTFSDEHQCYVIRIGGIVRDVYTALHTLALMSVI